jgi:hypothetical protein
MIGATGKQKAAGVTGGLIFQPVLGSEK